MPNIRNVKQEFNENQKGAIVYEYKASPIISRKLLKAFFIYIAKTENSPPLFSNTKNPITPKPYYGN